MKTVDQLLDSVKAKQKIGSDYKLAMYLGVSQGTVQNWRHARSLPDQKAVTRIANELGLDADVLLLEIESQRAGTDFARDAWRRIAQRLQSGAVHVAVMVGFVLAGFTSSPNAEATVLSPAAASNVQSVYYVKLRRAWRALRRAAGAIFGSFVLGSSHVQSADTDAGLFNPA